MTRRTEGRRTLALALIVAGMMLTAAEAGSRGPDGTGGRERNPVLEWNRIFVTTLIDTGTPNSSSQRLGAILHVAMFDAFNGVEQRFTPIVVTGPAPAGASGEAAVVSSAHAVLVALFPSRRPHLDAAFAESMAGRAADIDGRSWELGVGWGQDVARAVLAWRDRDGFREPIEPFTGGTAAGQWRPTPPAFTPMSAQSLAFTAPFVVPSATHFEPAPPRSLDSATYARDLRMVMTLGRATASTRTKDQTALAPFWEGNATVHWNQAATQIASARRITLSDSSRLLAVLNVAMADTAITVWSAKRRYGADPSAVTWRPVTAIALTGSAGPTASMSNAEWIPLVATPAHPEYPAGHPALNGAAATVLLAHFADAQRFTLTTRLSNVNLPPRRYTHVSRARADGNHARVWGGMHYPSTVASSDALGESIARYVEARLARELH